MSEETTVLLISKPVEVKYTCPHCEIEISQSIDEFMGEQLLTWSDFYEDDKDIECNNCGLKIKAEYEYD